MEKWSTFAEIAGSAAAALTGLLFVAVSIRIGVIGKSQELRNRAAQTLALFVTVLFVGILLSIPDQPVRILGIELVALAVITAVAMLVLDRRASAGPDPRDDTAHALASILEVVAPNAVTSILLLIAGLWAPNAATPLKRQRGGVSRDGFVRGESRAARSQRRRETRH